MNSLTGENMRNNVQSQNDVRRMRGLFAVLALCVAGGIAAAPLDLARVPLVVNASVPPNIMITFDDSGSMGFGYTPDLVEDTTCFWRRPYFYSPAFNKQYYNPAITYSPPLREDGTSFPNMSYTAAKVNGFDGAVGAPAINLGTGYLVSYWEGNNAFGTAVIRYDALSFSLTNPLGSLSGCDASNKRARFPFGAAGFYYRYNGSVTLPLLDTNVSNFTAVAIPTDQRTNFANWFSYYRTRGLAARTALSTAFARINPETRVGWQNLNRRAIAATTEIAAIEEGTSWRTNFFNWIHTSWNEFRFHPGYSGSYTSYGTPLRASAIRAGEFFRRSGTSDRRNPYWDPEYGEELSCRQNFQMMVTDGYWNEDNPGGSIGNYDRSGVTLPDGTLYGTGNAASRVYWNELTGGSGCNSGGAACLPSLADISLYYWARDLRGDLDNDVPAYFGDRSVGNIGGVGEEAEIYFNPANDPATWQRVVNFIVGFGVSGTLAYSDATGSPMTKAQRLMRLRRGDDTWPRLTNNTEYTIDDAWHAALNSRGQYLSAEDPQQLLDALYAILDNVNQRQGTTGTAGSSAFQRSDSLIFEASYDSGNWTGNVDAFAINPDGSPGAAAWIDGSAAAQLDARSPASRTVYINRARTGNANEVAFTWSNLSTEQQDWLNRDPITGTVDNLGSRRVDYIKGDRSREQSDGGPFRNRESIMGAYLASDLAYVQAPANGYAGRVGFAEGGEEYAQFRQDHLDRAPMLYIGGNDGMLHAFEALTGNEAWAFIPNKVSRNLGRLTTPQYQFVPFVNNAPVTADVYYNDSWHTVLVGTLGLGGQGVYAIDITNPTSPDVLWEFTDENSPLLGYTYGQPAITRLGDGTWVALVPGGYNNEGTVDYATRGLPNQTTESATTIGNGRAALFVVNIRTGALIDTFTLPATARGVASPTVADYEYDFKADFAVAGDLNGNLWRIGLRQDGDAPDYGTIERVFQGSSDRPITTPARIFPDPVSGEMIMVFGTGKYLELADREIDDDDPRQDIYGVRECRFRDSCTGYPITPGDLVEQTLAGVGGDFITMETTHYLDAEAAGWSLRLGNPGFFGGRLVGERIVDRALAIFSTGIVVLNSFIPSSEPCSPEGSGVLYILSAFTGGFALPDGVNEDGDQVLPGDPVFEGGASNAVGRFFENRPPTQFFDCPHGGCFVAGGNRFYGKPIIRRSGWREIPTD